MKRQNDLFLLIKSMSKAEKRYFKLYASKHIESERNNSVKLFDAIDAQDAYDQEAIRKRFAGERFSRQLSVQKNYLYGLILKSLRAFRAGMSTEVRVAELLHEVEILADRGLYGQCPDLLAQARAVAEQAEDFALTLKVMDFEHRVAYSTGDERRVHALPAEREEMLAKLSNMVEYLHLGYETLRRTTRHAQPGHQDHRAAAQQALETPLLGDGSRALSRRAQILRHTYRMVWHQTLGDFQRCTESALQCLEVIESFADVPVDLQHRALICHMTLLRSSLMAGRFDAVERHLERAHAMKTESYYMRRHMQLLLDQSAMILHIRCGRFAEARGFMPGLEMITRDYAHEIRPLILLTLLNQFAHLSFGLGEYGRSLEHTDAMLHMVRRGVQLSEPHIQSRVHAAILQYELGNMETVEYAVQTVRRYLIRINETSPSINLLLTYVLRLAGTTSAKTVRMETDRFLRGLGRKGITLADVQHHMIIDVAAWIESKRAQISYAEAFTRLHVQGRAQNRRRGARARQREEVPEG